MSIDRATARLRQAEGATHIGELQAWDVRTLQNAWAQTFHELSHVGLPGADDSEVGDLGVAVCRHVGDSTRPLMDIETDMSVLD